MADTDMSSISPILKEQVSQPSRRPTRLPPSRIYTINTPQETSFSAPKTAPIGPSSSPFRHSNRSTGNLHSSPNNNNFIGRSRSYSTSSGGVVHRSRADSEASRLALEAMILKRLERITQRLDNFNSQSHELHARTEELAKSFHEKAKRLYKVEDHMLRVQGKPGLSEAYLEDAGPRPRRLTNDLEELRMGVKTLRKKFQVAGSVVSAVEWWKRLKEDGQEKHSNSSNDNIDQKDDSVVSTASPSVSAASPIVSERRRSSSLSSSSSPSSPSSFIRTVSRKEGQTLQKIMTAPDAFSTMYTAPTTYDTVSSPDSLHPRADVSVAQSLRSPPLTPKGPPALLNTFSQRSYLADNNDFVHTSSNIKARPLSAIPDLEEPPLQLPLSPPTKAWTQDDNRKNNNDTAPTSLPDDIYLANVDKLTIQNSPQDNHKYDDITEEPLSVNSEIFASSSFTSVSAASASEAEKLFNRLTEPEPELEINGVVKAGCENIKIENENLQGNHIPIEQSVDETNRFIEENTSLNLASPGSSYATDAEALSVQEHETTFVSETTNEALAEVHHKHVPTPTILPESKDVEIQKELEHEKQQRQQQQQQEQEQEDSWIQMIWKILIRLEYLLLGTAVLGAMMPESFLTLCAGFLSAILYGALVIRHRMLASPEKEAPKPPIGNNNFFATTSTVEYAKIRRRHKRK
ncbi:hypothetical protein FBU30_001796 [Linnemannia zychae]|nr:hypothetical protein FBU30_001796 [Linnemannia zychae]